MSCFTFDRCSQLSKCTKQTSGFFLSDFGENAILAVIALMNKWKSHLFSFHFVMVVQSGARNLILFLKETAILEDCCLLRTANRLSFIYYLVSFICLRMLQTNRSSDTFANQLTPTNSTFFLIFSDCRCVAPSVSFSRE